MSITFYDLAGAENGLRFSPYCWRTKMALLHKGLDFETVPWRFVEKDVIAASGSGHVPVIVDNGNWIADSWEIATYLDRTYAGASLFGDDTSRALCRFVTTWCDTAVHRAIRPLALLRVMQVIDEECQAYFRESRERMLGMTLDEACADQAAARVALVETLAPAEQGLSQAQWLGGTDPCYADYALFGSLKWLHALGGSIPFPPDSAVSKWFERILDLHDGYARKAETADF